MTSNRKHQQPDILTELKIPIPSSLADKERRENDDGLDFLPPVPDSTAHLLNMAESKIKANSIISRRMSRKDQVKPKVAVAGKSRSSQSQVGGRKRNSKEKTILKEISTTSDPVQWLQNQAQARRRSRSLLSQKRRSLSKTKTDKKVSEVTIPDELEDKLISVGGYIMNIEKGLPPSIHASIKPRVSTKESGLQVEVWIEGVDPGKIHVEKRYNSILVIGVKDQDLFDENQNLTPSTKGLLGLKFEEDFLEVVNIFAPRDVFLAKVIVSQPDEKGRVLIKAP